MEWTGPWRKRETVRLQYTRTPQFPRGSSWVAQSQAAKNFSIIFLTYFNVEIFLRAWLLLAAPSRPIEIDQRERRKPCSPIATRQTPHYPPPPPYFYCHFRLPLVPKFPPLKPPFLCHALFLSCNKSSSVFFSGPSVLRLLSDSTNTVFQYLRGKRGILSIPFTGWPNLQILVSCRLFLVFWCFTVLESMFLGLNWFNWSQLFHPL